MKMFVILWMMVGFCYAASSRTRREIPKEFENININNYLKNELAVKFQFKCVTDDGPCDKVGKYLKTVVSELLNNQCANCDSVERDRARQIVSHVQKNLPREWERAVKKLQGGLVKPEDADRFENILGVRLDPKLVSPRINKNVTYSTPEIISTTTAKSIASTAESLEILDVPEGWQGTSSTTLPSSEAPPATTTVAVITPFSASASDETSGKESLSAAMSLLPVILLVILSNADVFNQ